MKTLRAGFIVAAICSVTAIARASDPANATPLLNSALPDNASSLAGQPLVVIEQSRINAAMTRLLQRIEQRAEQLRANPPATQPAHIASVTAKQPVATVDSLTAKKLAMIHEYDARIDAARLALRRGDAKPADVRQLSNEQSILARLPVERFGQLLTEADSLNAQRVDRYRQAFGELKTASTTVITILMKAGLVDTAAVMADDPLTEEIELARGVRRVYYQFNLPARDSFTPIRHHNGYVEFQLASAQGLWLPTWADLEGSPIALFDAEAFLPLQPFRVRFNGTEFAVVQDQPTEPPSALFSLLAPREPFGPANVLASKSQSAE